MTQLKPTMFREYDIRGLVKPDELSESAVETICRAYAAFLHRQNIHDDVVLGYDYRSYSERLANAAIAGLTASGVNVINLGMILTPMMYAAQYHYRARGGVMVTASHNPNGWSGLKLAMGLSKTLGPQEIQLVQEIANRQNFINGSGTVRQEDFRVTYQADLVKRVSIKRPIKAVVNTGNGTAGPIVPPILRAAGVEVVELLTEQDWNFPRYSPNPSKEEMMQDTGKKTVASQADVGLAIDADGDRLGVTDEKGEIVWPDRYLIVLARQILEQQPGAKIIFDVKSTKGLIDDISAHGGEPVIWKTGHSYIKAKMHETAAPLAGEMSGHIFYGPPLYYGFDDAAFVALKLLEYLATQKASLSQIIATTPQYYSTPSLQAETTDEGKYQIVEKLTQQFKDEGYDVNDINGARVSFPDGWGLVRASSNMPVLTLRFESKSKKGLEKIEKLFRRKLSQFPNVSAQWESG